MHGAGSALQMPTNRTHFELGMLMAEGFFRESR